LPIAFIIGLGIVPIGILFSKLLEKKLWKFKELVVNQ
jgi:hypothetical protein